MVLLNVFKGEYVLYNIICTFTKQARYCAVPK